MAMSGQMGPRRLQESQSAITSPSSIRKLPRPLNLKHVLFAQLQHPTLELANARSSDSPLPPCITSLLPPDSLLEYNSILSGVRSANLFFFRNLRGNSSSLSHRHVLLVIKG